MPPKLCFIDTETTGLDPDQHEIWEVGCVIRDDVVSESGVVSSTEDRLFVWQLPVDLARADPMALNVGQFHARRWKPADVMFAADSGASLRCVEGNSDDPYRRVLSSTQMSSWAQNFARLTWGAHMIGCVPSFDTDRLWRLLRNHGACPGWHYQPVDVETLAVGSILGGRRFDGARATDGAPLSMDRPDIAADVTGLPWDSEQVSLWFGIDPARYARHSALGDAMWARDLWDAVHENVITGGRG